MTLVCCPVHPGDSGVPPSSHTLLPLSTTASAVTSEISKTPSGSFEVTVPSSRPSCGFAADKSGILTDHPADLGLHRSLSNSLSCGVRSSVPKALKGSTCRQPPPRGGLTDNVDSLPICSPKSSGTRVPVMGPPPSRSRSRCGQSGQSLARPPWSPSLAGQRPWVRRGQGEAGPGA